jgi:hypothetical protein
MGRIFQNLAFKLLFSFYAGKYYISFNFSHKKSLDTVPLRQKDWKSRSLSNCFKDLKRSGAKFRYLSSNVVFALCYRDVHTIPYVNKTDMHDNDVLQKRVVLPFLQGKTSP